MVSFDKSRDGEFKKSVKSINSYLKMIDPSVSPISDKMVGDIPATNTQLSYANIRIEVIVAKPKGQTKSDLILSAAVCPLPKENLLPFYRQLLVWNNFQTDVAHLAINDQQGMVYVVMRRPVLGLDCWKFRDNVDKMSTVTQCYSHVEKAVRFMTSVRNHGH